MEKKIKLDRKKRALVRALAKRKKWDYKEIAAVFDVSLPIIKKIVVNGYVAVDDKPWEDARFYEKSDLEKLILRLPPATEKQNKPKKQVFSVVMSTHVSHEVILSNTRTEHM